MSGGNCFGCRGNQDRVGILLAQLGTPEAPTPKALRPYLRQFLSDPRIIEVPRIIWWFVLNCIILVFRPRRSARLYKRIWRESGSPLLVYTKAQTEKIAAKFKSNSIDVEVRFGMRVGNPSLEKGIDELIAAGCARIILVPMYPQYSATTTASVYDMVFAHLVRRRFVPTLKVVEPYYRHPDYLAALDRSIRDGLANIPADKKPSHLVFSFHGIPQKYVAKGDPYCCQCTETSEALRARFKDLPLEVVHTFQSRFGNDPWLIPYTDVTIEELGNQGAKHIALAAPGFTADCLETLDELGNEGLETFHEHGGESLHLIPCLNDHPAWIEALYKIIREIAGTWCEAPSANGCTWKPVSCPVQCALAQGKKG